MTLGNRLKKLRNKKGITQTDFANEINVHYQTVSRWERDLVLPDLSIFQEIVKALDSSIEELLGVEGKNSFKGVFESQKLINKIKSIRKEKGLTQSAFAKKIDISADSVSKWEQGKSLPDIEKILKISKVFNLSPSEIYYGISSKEEFEEVETKPINKKKLITAFISLCLVVVLVITFCCYFIVQARDFYYPIKSKVIITEQDGFYHNKYNNCYTSHVGIDIEAKEGQTVFAAIDGKINISITLENGTGFQIENENGYRAIYYYVELYDTIVYETEVYAGQSIGKVVKANVGMAEEDIPIHLHFELYKDGEIVDIEDFI